MLRVADAWANEGDHGVRRIVFRLRLSRPAAGGERVLVHTVAATATAGTDFRSLASVEVVFPAGARFVDVAVDVYGDRRDEADEVLGLVATTPDRVTIGDGLGVGVIRDDDRRCGPPRRW